MSYYYLISLKQYCWIFIKRIEGMIINLRNFDCSVNSPCQYQRKCMDKSIANIDTDVRV